jgi:hypothetical protein
MPGLSCYKRMDSCDMASLTRYKCSSQRSKGRPLCNEEGFPCDKGRFPCYKGNFPRDKGNSPSDKGGTGCRKSLRVVTKVCSPAPAKRNRSRPHLPSNPRGGLSCPTT